MRLLTIINTLLRINITKTIFFNLKLFPIKHAIYFPLVFYGRCQVLMVEGKCLKINIKPKFGMLKVGKNQSLAYGIKNSHPEVTYFQINGALELNGYNNEFANGCKIYVKKGGKLSLNGDVLLQNRCKIHCADNITIGYYSQFSWETQIFDTDMHYLIDENGYVKNNKGSIVIGDYCWVGNRCTIQKGTKLPDYMVVASNSVVNKDFTNQLYGVIAGVPAHYVKGGQKRLLDFRMERLLDKYFQENSSIIKTNISDIDTVEKNEYL